MENKKKEEIGQGTAMTKEDFCDSLENHSSKSDGYL